MERPIDLGFEAEHEQHETFVRELARRLVGDPNAAEDLVAEVWVAHWRQRARPLDPRSWFGRVARNLALSRLRAGSRRRDREARAAAAEALEDAEPSRAELCQRVLAAVSRLPAESRRVLELRYLEGLEAAQVAEQLSLPLETVRTRIKRGLAKLRERLERELGPGGLAALLPLCPEPGSAPSEAAGFAANARLTAGLVLLLGCGAAWLVFDTRARGAEVPQPAVSNPDPAATTAVHRALPERVVAADPAFLRVRLQRSRDLTPLAQEPVFVGELAEVTDGAGEIRLPRAGVHSVRVERSLSHAAHVFWVDAGASAAAVLELCVPSGLVISGTVLDPSGGRALGSEIVAQRFELDAAGNPRDVEEPIVVGVDLRGRFELGGLRPLTRVFARRAGEIAREELRLEFGGEAAFDDLCFELVPARTLAGVLLDDFGRALGGTSVSSHDPAGRAGWRAAGEGAAWKPIAAATHSAADGAFVLELPATTAEVVFERPGCERRVLSLDAASGEVQLASRSASSPSASSSAGLPSRTWRATVVSSSDGEPLAGASLVLLRCEGAQGVAPDAGARGWRPVACVDSDATGAAELEVDRGALAVVHALGHTTRLIALDAHLSSQVELYPARDLTLVLFGRSRRPLARTSIVLSTPDGEPAFGEVWGARRSSSFTTDGQGRVVLIDVPATWVTVEVLWSGSTRPLRAEFDGLRAGEEVELAFDVEEELDISSQQSTLPTLAGRIELVWLGEQGEELASWHGEASPGAWREDPWPLVHRWSLDELGRPARLDRVAADELLERAVRVKVAPTGRLELIGPTRAVELEVRGPGVLRTLATLSAVESR